MITRLPGLIDVHVHLREPGATHKEDFRTGSRAALKGGFTFVIDMPNNSLPTVSGKRLQAKILLSQKALCEVGFHYGTNGKNLETFRQIWDNPRVFGLKVYLNETTGDLFIDKQRVLDALFRAWDSPKPIVVHAEGEKLALALALAKRYKRKLHVCHISQAKEVKLLRKAKLKGSQVSAGVTPHHLFMTQASLKKLRGFGIMKPPLGEEKDQEALWEGLLDGTIDMVETDHAPHTKKEKERSPAPFGVPGLETALGLLFRKVKEKKIIQSDVVTFLYEKPKAIFRIPDQPHTYVELDPDKPFIVGEEGYESKCGWSPFEGWELYGKIESVVIRGKTLLKEGKIHV